MPDSFKSFSKGVTNHTGACLTANLQATQGQLEYVQNKLKEAWGKLYQAHLNEQRALDKLQLAIPPPAAPAAPTAPATFTVMEGEASASVPASAPIASPTSAPAPAPALSTAELFMMTCAAKPSECIPDPDKFKGNQSDLCHFNTQICQKMQRNYDCFPDTQDCMAYVNNCLKGLAYALILPYIKDGECLLSDYDTVLKVLDCTYGDLDKDFATFFSKFQCLALEGEELCVILLHHDPPSYKYPEFTNFLQNLENHMTCFSSVMLPTTQTCAPPVQNHAPPA
ncbi:Protein FAM127C [Ceratocystis lukuohia]|uniref:Protein FAM127C n=1 Tax=Ceratocystis lukuohia TaxID=2019550 RepID=A0ABR4M8V8_9PEZI